MGLRGYLLSMFRCCFSEDGNDDIESSRMLYMTVP